MRPVIVVGGGEVGSEVARALGAVTVVELDQDRAKALHRLLPEASIVTGSATELTTLLRAGIRDAKVLVVALGDDGTSRAVIEQSVHYRNLEAVLAVIRDGSRLQEFERLGVHGVIVRSRSAAAAVLSMLRPAKRPFHDIVLTEGAATIGRKVGTIHLPKGTNIVAVKRDESLLPPNGDLVLETMDVLHVSSPIEEVNAVRAALLGDARRLFPLSKILVPMRDATYLERELQESLLVGTFCMAPVITTVPKGEEALAERARDIADRQGVPFHVLEGFDPWEFPLRNALTAAATVDLEWPHPDAKGDIVAQLKKERGGRVPRTLGVGEEVEVDLLTLRSEPLGPLGRPKRRALSSRASEDTMVPLLFARHPEPYASMLVLMDGGPRNSDVVTLALRMSIALGSRLTVLDVLPEGHAEGLRLLAHMRKTGDVYGIDVVVLELAGNPTLELLTEVRSGRHDLTFVDRACKTVTWDIIKKVAMQAPRSVILY